jgi:hypothetical protein
MAAWACRVVANHSALTRPPCNALAHGGIAYLNSDGKNTYGEPVAMYAFMSGIYDDANPKKLTGLSVLRVGQDDYLRFLHGWVKWLVKAGLTDSLAA